MIVIFWIAVVESRFCASFSCPFIEPCHFLKRYRQNFHETCDLLQVCFQLAWIALQCTLKIDATTRAASTCNWCCLSLNTTFSPAHQAFSKVDSRALICNLAIVTKQILKGSVSFFRERKIVVLVHMPVPICEAVLMAFSRLALHRYVWYAFLRL